MPNQRHPYGPVANVSDRESQNIPLAPSYGGISQPDIRSNQAFRNATRQRVEKPIAESDTKLIAEHQSARRILPNPIRNVNFSQIIKVTGTPQLAVQQNIYRRRLLIIQQTTGTVTRFWFFNPNNSITTPGAYIFDSTAAPQPPYQENSVNISIDEIWIAGTINDIVTIYEGVDI